MSGTQRREEYVGPWKLRSKDMRWVRPHKYRNFQTGELADTVINELGPIVRPGILRDVVLLDVPHAVYRSTDSDNEVLPDDLKGFWQDLNPALPHKTVEISLGQIGLKPVWDEYNELEVEKLQFGPHELTAHVVPVAKQNWREKLGLM